MAVEDGFLEGKVMDINSPEFAAALAGKSVKADPAEQTDESESTEEPGEKDPAVEEAEKESPSPEEEEEEEETDDPKVAAITKELKRVRTINKERDTALATLTAEMAALKQRAEAAPKTADEAAVVKLAEMADGDYERLRADWTDELSTAKAELKVATEKGDEDESAKAQARVTKAQHAVTLFGKATDSRAAKVAADKIAADTDVLAIKAELTNVKAVYDKAFPDLANEASPIWKAGKKEFDSNPRLMSKLGPMAEMIATALAIIKNPKLVGRDPSTVRKDLINNIEETVGKSLAVGNRGGGKGNKGNATIPQFTDLQSFNDYIEKIKGG